VAHFPSKLEGEFGGFSGQRPLDGRSRNAETSCGLPHRQTPHGGKLDLEFSEVVRDALYEKFEPYKQRHERHLDLDTVLQRACAKNYTLRAVAALCAKWDDRTRSFVRNDRIHAVVNFNLDALLREYVAVRYKRPLVRSVERASKSRDAAKINLYYMHGFLRFDSKAQDAEKEAFDKLVLTEQEYFNFFNSPTSIFNYLRERDRKGRFSNRSLHFQPGRTRLTTPVPNRDCTGAFWPGIVA
jgi:SIR2-like domain